ncbi:alpha/beta fold hydrolase [Pseudanabaena sp. PCC 6802]|uniref:alpha/beta fold hydrolase n=1 Tax=Pseudanabaena sp. PCC 6802 TaxID=118173 RepID=UPI000344F366|nr:alpha/beta hydrolase [Pseudanabaena sp. PCC 6802]
MLQDNLSILCLHGHPGSGDAMSVFTQHFWDRGFRVIAPDLRGYGRSQRQHPIEQPFAMLEHLSDLVNLLENSHIDRCIVLGWSLGGILAMELALKFNDLYPGKIAGLILIASAARPCSSHPKVPWWQVMNTGLAVLAHRLTHRLLPHSKLAIWLGKRSLLQYLIQQHTTFAYDRIANEGMRAFLQTSKFATKALFDAMHQGYDRRQDLARIQVPCLAIAGECDRHITAESSRETAMLLPNSTWICYPQVAHLLPWEIPTQLMADIDLWLERNGF